jgi:HSP20 family protein
MLPTRVMRQRPVSPFDLLDHDFNRLLQRWWGEGEATTYGSYPVDIREDQDHIYIEAELPGFRKDELDITMENGVLTISAERRSAGQEDKDKASQEVTHLSERKYVRLARRFSIPTAVDENKIEAQLQDGVLHLKLTKREEVKPRKIEVR